MRIAYINLFDDYTCQYSGQNGNYPAANVQDSRLSKIWRTTALSSHTITIDSGTGNTITPTIAALLGTNLSTGGTYKIQGSSSSGFGSSTEANLTRVNSDYLGVFTTSLTAKRYWRFLIKDTGSTDTYMSVGRAWLGSYITIAHPVEMSFPEAHMDSSVYSLSYSGQLYGDEGVIRRAYDVTFPYFNSTQKTAFDTFLSTVKRYSPFLTFFDENDLTKIKPLYGFKPNEPRYEHIYGYQWKCTFRLEEVK